MVLIKLDEYASKAKQGLAKWKLWVRWVIPEEAICQMMFHLDMDDLELEDDGIEKQQWYAYHLK